MALVACTQGHCRRPTDLPAAAKPLETPAPAPVDASASPAPAKDRVFVYKYDGSLQCKMGKPITLDAMAKELGTIPVFSKAKKTDGLMHIQVCGSITGMANVFEIPVKFLKAAESKGFKKWSFE
jgi:hypothetical protein